MQATIAVRRDSIFHFLQFTLWNQLILQLLQLAIPRLLKLLWCGVAFGFRAKRKCPGVFAPVIICARARSNAAALDHGLVQTASATVKNFTHHVKRVAILVAKRHGVIAHIHFGLEISLGVHALLRHLLGLQRDHLRRLHFACLKSAKVLLNLRLHIGGFEITNNDAHQIVGTVVGVPIFHGAVHGVTVQVTGPTNHGP